MRESGRLRRTEATGIVLVLLPPGTFAMGAQASDPAGPNHDPHAFPNEGPPLEVQLEPFFIAKHELTQHQWMVLSGGKNPSRNRPETQLAVTLDHPVESVSWDNCHDLLRRHSLELPTEAQWEYACRGGTTSPWWTGTGRETLASPPAVNVADMRLANVNPQFVEAARVWPEYDDGFDGHAKVDSLRPNAFGLLCVLGNVHEWCRDPFLESHAAATPRPGDGAREIRGPVASRTVRGGGWSRSVYDARCAARRGLPPGEAYESLGVRPARQVRR